MVWGIETATLISPHHDDKFSNLYLSSLLWIPSCLPWFAVLAYTSMAWHSQTLNTRVCYFVTTSTVSLLWQAAPFLPLSSIWNICFGLRNSSAVDLCGWRSVSIRSLELTFRACKKASASQYILYTYTHRCKSLRTMQMWSLGLFWRHHVRYVPNTW